jgi:hypothetical protein
MIFKLEKTEERRPGEWIYNGGMIQEDKRVGMQDERMASRKGKRKASKTEKYTGWRKVEGQVAKEDGVRAESRGGKKNDNAHWKLSTSFCKKKCMTAATAMCVCHVLPLLSRAFIDGGKCRVDLVGLSRSISMTRVKMDLPISHGRPGRSVSSISLPMSAGDLIEFQLQVNSPYVSAKASKRGVPQGESVSYHRLYFNAI